MYEKEKKKGGLQRGRRRKFLKVVVILEEGEVLTGTSRNGDDENKCKKGLFNTSCVESFIPAYTQTRTETQGQETNARTLSAVIKE